MLPITPYADKEKVSFMVLGDTGEGDDSQYQVLARSGRRPQDTDFMFIVSDVIYPAGDIGDYRDKFYWPYCGLPGPDLRHAGQPRLVRRPRGFMIAVLRRRPRPAAAGQGAREPVRSAPSATSLWREPSEATQEQSRRCGRAPAASRPASRLPYFAIELKELVLVGIDTGISRVIDARAGRVASRDLARARRTRSS